MRLTERAGRGVELTPAAQILVGHTDALLARLDTAEADLAALRDQVAGRVALAAFPSAAASLVPAAWAALADSAPQVRLDLTEMEPEESLPAVLRGETDVAVAHEYDLLPRPLDPLFERRDLLDDPVVLAIPADYPADSALAGRRRPFAGWRRPGSAGYPGRPAVPRPAPGHQLRRDDPAGLRPGRLRAPCGRPRHAISRSCSAWSRPAPGSPWCPRLAARWLPPRVRLVPPAEPVTRRVFTVSRRGGDRKPAVRVVLDALSAAAGPAAALSAAAGRCGYT